MPDVGCAAQPPSHLTRPSHPPTFIIFWASSEARCFSNSSSLMPPSVSAQVQRQEGRSFEQAFIPSLILAVIQSFRMRCSSAWVNNEGSTQRALRGTDSTHFACAPHHPRYADGSSTCLCIPPGRLRCVRPSGRGHAPPTPPPRTAPARRACAACRSARCTQAAPWCAACQTQARRAAAAGWRGNVGAAAAAAAAAAVGGGGGGGGGSSNTSSSGGSRLSDTCCTGSTGSSSGGGGDKAATKQCVRRLPPTCSTMSSSARSTTVSAAICGGGTPAASQPVTVRHRRAKHPGCPCTRAARPTRSLPSSRDAPCCCDHACRPPQAIPCGQAGWECLPGSSPPSSPGGRTKGTTASNRVSAYNTQKEGPPPGNGSPTW